MMQNIHTIKKLKHKNINWHKDTAGLSIKLSIYTRGLILIHKDIHIDRQTDRQTDRRTDGNYCSTLAPTSWSWVIILPPPLISGGIKQ